MNRIIALFFLKIVGWKSTKITTLEKKAVILVAPHTSYCDFILGKLYFWTIDLSPKFLIKSDYFYFPLRNVLKWLGGIPVKGNQRGKRFLDYMVKLFAEKEPFYLVITPEGTRKRRAKWKRGFYEIAIKANVPIYLSKLDYGKKLLDLGEIFYPTGDFKKDVMYIQSRYNDVIAKYPSQFAKEY